MKILYLSRIDCAGAAAFLSRAVNHYTEHEARFVRLRDANPLQFPVDIVTPPAHVLGKLIAWADVIHVHDFAYPLPTGVDYVGKPTIVTYHGTAYRDSHAKYDRECRVNGWLQTVSTIDLTLLNGAGWMPDTRTDLSRFTLRERKGFVVVHAPTKRAVKDTDAIISALGSLKGVRLELIENTPFEECLRRKAAGRVLVDQFKLGYGCNAIEAWAMGMVVVANATPDILRAMRAKLGHVPFVQSTLDELPETILRLKKDRAFYDEALERGRRHWREHHRPDVVAKRAVAFYHEALRGRGIAVARAREQPVVARIKYIGRNNGVMTWYGPRTKRRYKAGGGSPVIEVDPRDLATGDSTNPGLLEMTEGGRRRAFRRVS